MPHIGTQSGFLYYYPPVSLRAATISCRSSDMLVCDAIQKLNAES
jgi:hypothetical protein